MADSIDVDKLKNDAFNAIDALFIEEEEQDGPVQVEFEAEEKPQKEKLIVSSMDDFAILDEFILSLDWEFSEAEINRFVEHLQNIVANNPDPYNQAMVKMLNSIVTYLKKAQNKAYPETFNILAEVIAVLKQINSPGFDRSQIKNQVSGAYRQVKELKINIAEYNARLSQNLVTPDEFMPIKHKRPVPKSSAGHQVITIQSQDFIDEGDIFSEKESGLSTATGILEPSDLEQIETKIIERLDQYEQRLSFLEQQNQTLRQIITEQREKAPPLEDGAEGNLETVEEDEEFMLDDFSSEFEAFTPVDEPETVDIDEIIADEPEQEALEEAENEDSADPMNIFDSEPDDETTETADFEAAGDAETAGGTEPDDAFSLDDPEAGTLTEDKSPDTTESPSDPIGDIAEEASEYVRVFKLDDQNIAIPADYFNNVYKLPGKLKKQIHTMESVALGDLSSFFRKLSKNMKGSLQDVPEKELKKMSADINLISEDLTDYPFAVLCSCDDLILLIPVTGKHENASLVAGKRNDIENRLSPFSVEIDNQGTIPLIIPC